MMPRLPLTKQLSICLPISSATLAWAGRNASQQPTTTKLLFNVGIKSTIFLALLKLPQEIATLFGFFCGAICLL